MLQYQGNMFTRNTECFVEDKQVVELDRLHIFKQIELRIHVHHHTALNKAVV